MRDEERYNTFGAARINDRQLDELIGLARGLTADAALNQSEIEFLQKWLAANVGVIGQPLIASLYRRISEVLDDGFASDEEKEELLHTLNDFTRSDFELGEVLKSTALPLCRPAPDIIFQGQKYCFTGTFAFGSRSICEKAAQDKGASITSINQKTNVLVIGAYATESWKHSAFGNKILKACELRDAGFPIKIVAEAHWKNFL